MNAEWKSRYDAAIDATRYAGRIALRYFEQTGLEVQWKANLSPVTVADRETERAVRETLQSRFPHDGFWGEEYGQLPGPSDYRWIIDPIDGTRNFVRGIPFWGTLVGLQYRDELIAGVVALPALGCVYHALRGEGAYRDGHRIRVSDIPRLDQGQLFYSGASWFLAGPCRDAFIALCLQSQRQRGFGDCYGFILVAQGAGEAMIDYGVYPWDVAALVPIVEEAGGRFTDWTGQPTWSRPDVLASNGKVHDHILQLIREHTPSNFPSDLSHLDRHVT